MTAEPRVWVGVATINACWLNVGMGWFAFDRVLIFGDIFVPGDQPMPTIDPAEMKTIATCKVVDWT